jgi:anti-sigma regulatory factor (Ser/Thr protein kinase)
VNRPSGRRGPHAPAPAGRFDRVYAGESRTLREARNDVVGFLKESGFDEDLQARAALVLSELASNAVQASPGCDYGVRVSLDDGDGAVVEVSNQTEYEQPPPHEHWGPSSVLAPRGRGLMIVDKLSDGVVVELPGSRTVVVAATLRAPSRE